MEEPDCPAVQIDPSPKPLSVSTGVYLTLSDRRDHQSNSKLQGKAAGGVGLGNDTVLSGETWIQPIIKYKRNI